jgi:PUA domain protein
MFKKFEKDSVSSTTQCKSSVQKAHRAKIIESYPHIEAFIEQILPKKEAIKIVKWLDYVHLAFLFCWLP